MKLKLLKVILPTVFEKPDDLIIKYYFVFALTITRKSNFDQIKMYRF